MPPVAILAASALAPAISSAIGSAASSGSRNSAEQLQRQALQSIMNVRTPDISQMQLALSQYQNAGQLAPEMQSVVDSPDSLMSNISTDPRLANAQMQALSKLQELGVSGLRPEDEAALARIRQSSEQDAHARDSSILQNMQERGMGGAGAELAARLGSSQASSNRAAQAGLDVGGLASQRALEAIAQGGQLGGQIRSQEFGEEGQKAQAQDVINRYNAMNRQQIMGQNVGSRNAAQAQNLSNQQAIMNANTGLSNQQQQYNRGLAQQDFQNQMQRGQAASGAQNQAAGQQMQQAAQTQQMWGGIGQGVGQAATGIAQHQQNQGYMDFLTGKKPSAAAPSQSASPAGIPSDNEWANFTGANRKV